MLVDTALSWSIDGRRSNSSPGVVLACLRMRRVRSFRELDSIDLRDHWLNWVEN
jgi:hypothetical protein